MQFDYVWLENELLKTEVKRVEANTEHRLAGNLIRGIVYFNVFSSSCK